LLVLVGLLSVTPILLRILWLLSVSLLIVLYLLQVLSLLVVVITCFAVGRPDEVLPQAH
jgi:hypothetical protein